MFNSSPTRMVPVETVPSSSSPRPDQEVVVSKLLCSLNEGVGPSEFTEWC